MANGWFNKQKEWHKLFISGGTVINLCKKMRLKSSSKNIAELISCAFKNKYLKIPANIVGAFSPAGGLLAAKGWLEFFTV